MDWKKILRWALIVFFASIVFHIANAIVEKGFAELDRLKRHSARAKLGSSRTRHFTPEEVFSGSDKQ